MYIDLQCIEVSLSMIINLHFRSMYSKRDGSALRSEFKRVAFGSTRMQLSALF